MDERRRSQRHEIEEATGSFRLAGEFRLVDISLAGLGIESSLRLHKGQTYRGRVDWNGRCVEVRGRVAWTRLVGTEKVADGDILPIYQAGIEFESPVSEEQGALRQLVEEATDFHRGDRLFGRYLATDRSASLALDAEVRIRKVSRTGMLIESPTAVEIGSGIPFDLCFGERAFRADTRVVTCESGTVTEGEEPTVWHVGVEFRDLDAETRRVLDEILEELADTSQEWS
ncbi:MAG: PilZ domain-containing protein [Thermoanaerobaculia bacterium]